MKTKTGMVAFAAAATVVLAGCSTSTSQSTGTAMPQESSPSASASMSPSAPAGTIVDVAAGNQDFTTLVSAVKAAGLAETLSGEGPFTVFAPTNEAFAALPPGLLDKLLQPANKATLTKILTYHVVPGEVTSDKITAGKVKTVEGQTVAITTDGGVRVNEALVEMPDVMASNGVIHVIDAVLLPPDVNPDKL